MTTPVDTDATQEREADRAVDDLFVRRWSPRAMNGEPLAERDLERLLEAARWAPSSFNIQPWRFIYAIRGSADFDRLFDALVPDNQAWAKRAGALLAIASLTVDPSSGKPAPTHSFDAGAAWMAFALQGAQMQLVVHGMAGFDRDRLAEAIDLPERYALEAMIAVGHPGDLERLPDDLQEAEEPSDRKPIDAFSFVGRFPAESTDE